jgi:hypothetical protein
VAASTAGIASGIAAGDEHAVAFGPPPPAATNLPELGRCVAASGKTGEWAGLHCERPAGGKGTARWIPGAEHKLFEGVSTGGATLETAHHKVVCATSLIEGEYTGAKTSTATLTLKGCIDAATKARCQSNPAQEGEIQDTTALEGRLGFISNGEKPVVGLDLAKAPTAANFASFYCGGFESPEFQATIEGSLIGKLAALNHMVSEFTLAFKGAKGSQTPERFEGGLKDTLTISLLKGAEPPVNEAASIATTLLIANEEALEIKAK